MTSYAAGAVRKLKSPFCGFCVRCQQKVYPAERVGLELNIMLHTNCFKCAQCGLTLTMSTFLLTTDPVTGKKTVLCKTHAPKANGNSLDPSSFAIRNAVQAQRINKQDSVNGQVRRRRCSFNQALV